MKQAHETRLRRLEQQTQPRHGGFELWLSGDTGEMIGPDGEVLTLEEFERRYPDAVSIDDGPPAAGIEEGVTAWRL